MINLLFANDRNVIKILMTHNFWLKILNEYIFVENINILYNLAHTQINNAIFEEKIKNYLSYGFSYPNSLSKSLKDITNLPVPFSVISVGKDPYRVSVLLSLFIGILKKMIIYTQ